MKFRSRILILSSLTIALSLVLIIMSTYALFTDTISITHHLQAGTLDISLKRTNLEYNVLDSSGYLKTIENNEIIDLSNTSTNKLNVFGIDNNTLIVPGNFYLATLELSNNGNVAFKYWIEIISNDEVLRDLANQLEVKVITYNEGKIKEHTSLISDGLFVGCETSPLGELSINDELVNFQVKITFLDSSLNNLAQGDKVNFDIIVYAVQVVD